MKRNSQFPRKIVFLGVLIILFCIYSLIPTFTNNSPICVSSSNENDISVSGNRLVEYNNHFKVDRFANYRIMFNVKSVDYANGSSYVDIYFLIMDKSTYDYLVSCINKTDNLKHLMETYPFFNYIICDGSHWFVGSYNPPSPQEYYVVFVNINNEQKTSKLTYNIQFESQTESTEPDSDDDTNITPIQNYPIFLIPLLLLLVILGGIVVVVIQGISRRKKTIFMPKYHVSSEIPQTLKIEPVQYCPWCGLKLERIARYCPRCGEEIDY